MNRSSVMVLMSGSHVSELHTVLCEWPYVMHHVSRSHVVVLYEQSHVMMPVSGSYLSGHM